MSTSSIRSVPFLWSWSNTVVVAVATVLLMCLAWIIIQYILYWIDVCKQYRRVQQPHGQSQHPPQFQQFQDFGQPHQQYQDYGPGSVANDNNATMMDGGGGGEYYGEENVGSTTRFRG